MRDAWRTKTGDFPKRWSYTEEESRTTDHSVVIQEIAAAKSEGKVDFIVTCLLGQPLVEFLKQAHDAGLIGADFPVVDLVLQFNI